MPRLRRVLRPIGDGSKHARRGGAEAKHRGTPDFYLAKPR